MSDPSSPDPQREKAPISAGRDKRYAPTPSTRPPGRPTTQVGRAPVPPSNSFARILVVALLVVLLVIAVIVVISLLG